MRTRRAAWLRRIAVAAALALCAAGVDPSYAQQRELHWDALDVEATLDDTGTLHVVERQSMVFTGDWNGGERIFNLRPRQDLRVIGVDRIDPSTGQTTALTEHSYIDDVDEYAMTDAHTLRWRSRLPSDPPFRNTAIRYAIGYELSGVLLKDGDTYTLDHDFAFPDRDGEIRRFSLKLTLDPAWQPNEPVRDVYTAAALEPGTSFVLTVPMRFSGAGTPLANDGSRAPELHYAVAAIVGFFALAVVWFFGREAALGRFAPVDPAQVTPAWIREHIVAHPAEVVGAAWDDNVGAEEVVALLARLNAEGTLTSQASGSGMHMTLNVDRSELDGYERALVDGLFFDGRESTSTSDVKQHYKATGFDPSAVIGPGLKEKLAAFLPQSSAARLLKWPSLLLFLGGFGLLINAGFADDWNSPAPIIIGVIAILAGGLLQIPGLGFRQRVDWGAASALKALVLPAALCAFAVWYLWVRVGAGYAELPLELIAAIAVLTIWITNTSINGLKSRQTRASMAVRKRLTAARQYFVNELTKDHPALEDAWYPWILAFGLTKEADSWSVRHPVSDDDRRRQWRTSSSGSSSPGSSSSSSDGGSWTGGGGRSGGAGASAAWTTAAAGMAAGVSAPSSSGSGRSGGGSSSSSGSSGGGGGGGW